MALIKLGGLITQISGKIGGQSMATGRGGSYIKNIGSYTTQRNTLSISKLNSFSSLSQVWRTLDKETRSAWGEAAGDFPYTNRVGELKYLSGYNLFIQFNGNLIQQDQSIITSAPSPGSFVPDSGWNVIEAGGEFFLQIPSSFPNTYYSFEMTRPVSPGRGPKGLNFVSVLKGTTPSIGVNIAIDEAYTERFGYYPEGSRYHYRLNLVRTASGQQLKNIIAGSYEL